ncbi:MAG: hypothetical protein AAF928_09165 [Myxococcota bacterium]
MGQETTENLAATYHVLHDEPSEDDVATWIDTYGLSNPTFGAVDSGATLAALEERECAFVVDTATMTVGWKACGCVAQDGGCVPSVLVGLDELARALAP